MSKLLFVVFGSSFILNFIWENAHSYLYIHYQGELITEAILARAALFDAFVTTLPIIFFGRKILRPRNMLLTLFILFLFAIGLERFALVTNRWAYTGNMPILPVLDVGLTPAFQLALLAFVSYRFAGFRKSRN